MPIIECRKKKTVLTLKRLRRKPFTYLRKTLRVSGLEKNLAVAQLMYIVGMSARMNAAVGAPEDYRRRQLAMILEGMFSASKSYLKNRVLSLLPEQWIKRAQEMSVAYLIRCSNLAGKIIALDEAYLSNDVLALIRQLLSEGHGERNLCTNGEATELKVTGPIALIDTGLEEKKRQQQDQSRAITVAVDATEGAISAAKNSVIRSVSTEGIKRQHRLEKWTAVFREFALGLQDDLLVTINEKALASIVKSLDNRPAALRVIEQIETLLRTVAYLRQHTRRKLLKGDRRFILVTASDYKTVYRILKKAHVRDNFRADLKHNAAEFLKEVRPHFERGDSRLSAYDLRDLTGLTYKQVRCRVLELADAGALQKNGKNEGRQLWALTPVGRNIGLENMFSQLTPPDEVTGF